MDIEIIRNIDRIKSLSAEWDEILTGNANMNPFITVQWMLIWWDFFGKDKELYVLHIYDNEITVGFFPLMVRRKLLYREYCFIGRPQGSHIDLIVRQGYEEKFIEETVDHLLSISGSSLFMLHGMNRDNKCSRIFMKKLAGRQHFVKTLKTYFINMTSVGSDEFFRSRKSHYTIAQTFKRERSLSKVCTLNFSKAEADEIDAIFPLHEKRWSRKNDENGFGKGIVKCFFNYLACNNGQKDGSPLSADVYLLKAGETPIAFTYTVSCGGRVTFYRLAHDDDFALFKPGMIVTKKTIETCFINSCDIFDFSTGDELYKQFWTDDYELTDQIIFGTDTIISSIIIAAGRLRYMLHCRLKKVRILVYFKKVTIGRIKYIVSFKPVLSFFAGAVKCIRQNGSLHAVLLFAGNTYNNLTDNGIRLYKKKHRISMPFYSNDFSLKVIPSLDELPFLKELLYIDTEKITHRYYKGSKCILIYRNSIPAGYIWICNSEIWNRNRIIWKARKTGDLCCYDLCIFRQYRSKKLMSDILQYLIKKLSPKGRSRLYLLVNCLDRKTIAIADEIFDRADSCETK